MENALSSKHSLEYERLATGVLADIGLNRREGPVKNRKMPQIIFAQVSTLLSSFGGIVSNKPIEFASPEYEHLARATTQALMQGPTRTDRIAAVVSMLAQGRTLYDAAEERRGYVDTTPVMMAETSFDLCH